MGDLQRSEGNFTNAIKQVTLSEGESNPPPEYFSIRDVLKQYSRNSLVYMAILNGLRVDKEKVED